MSRRLGKPGNPGELAERRLPSHQPAHDSHSRRVALGATPAQVAIAWLLHRPTPPTLVPIVAARREEQIGENVAALDVRLDDELVARLDEAAAPQLGFPRNFLESQSVRELIYGETFPHIAA